MTYGPRNEPPPSEKEAVNFLQEAYDMGLNFIDTAATYGTAERIWEKIFKNQNARLFISTKVSLPQTTSIRIIHNSYQRSNRKLQEKFIFGNSSPGYAA